jgi:hypothetical protein
LTAVNDRRRRRKWRVPDSRRDRFEPPSSI